MAIERELVESGVGVVAGIDEVGRGSWAGPLTLAAVIPNYNDRIYKVRDSKILTPADREQLHDRIYDWAQAIAIGHASVDECTELGMADAQRLAAKRALAGLDTKVDHVLVDGSWDFINPPPPKPTRKTPPPDTPAPFTEPKHGVTKLVKGDAKSLSIAAASIVAKVTRDRLMVEMADHYPGYWFESNKGYPCPKHIAALQAMGPCAIHRRAWIFMDDLRWSGIPRVGIPTDADSTADPDASSSFPQLAVSE